MIYLRIFFLLLLINISISGQQSKISVKQIEEAYNNINFERVILLSKEAIENDKSYSVPELIDIYKIRGFAFFHLGNEADARSSFLTALSLKPDIELDEVTVSPKIIDFFNNLKNKNQQTVEPDISTIEKQYILLEDPRPESALKSLILPGWGQYYKGEKNKAYITFSLFTANSAALILSAIKEKSTHDEYLKARVNQDIKSKYADYNNWYRARQILTYSEILIWTYAFADALWSPPEKENLFSINFSPNSISLNYRF